MSTGPSRTWPRGGRECSCVELKSLAAALGRHRGWPRDAAGQAAVGGLLRLGGAVRLTASAYSRPASQQDRLRRAQLPRPRRRNGQGAADRAAALLKADGAAAAGRERCAATLLAAGGARGELALVVGRAASHVSEADALDYVLGYTCLDDVHRRDIQRREKVYARAKGFDTFCPVGPWLETEIGDPKTSTSSCVSTARSASAARPQT